MYPPVISLYYIAYVRLLEEKKEYTMLEKSNSISYNIPKSLGYN